MSEINRHENLAPVLHGHAASVIELARENSKKVRKAIKHGTDNWDPLSLQKVADRLGEATVAHMGRVRLWVLDKSVPEQLAEYNPARPDYTCRTLTAIYRTAFNMVLPEDELIAFTRYLPGKLHIPHPVLALPARFGAAGIFNDSYLTKDFVYSSGEGFIQRTSVFSNYELFEQPYQDNVMRQTEFLDAVSRIDFMRTSNDPATPIAETLMQEKYADIADHPYLLGYFS